MEYRTTSSSAGWMSSGPTLFPCFWLGKLKTKYCFTGSSYPVSFKTFWRLERSACDWLSLLRCDMSQHIPLWGTLPFRPSSFLCFNVPSSLQSPLLPVLCVSHSLFLLFHMVSRPFPRCPTIVCTLMCALALPRRPQQTRNPCEALVFLSPPSILSSSIWHWRDAWGIIVFFPEFNPNVYKDSKNIEFVWFCCHIHLIIMTVRSSCFGKGLIRRQ